MFDAHTLTKEALARLVGGAAGIRMLPSDMISPDARAHISSPVALKRGLDAKAVAQSVEQALLSPLNALLGERAFAGVREENGHLHFFLTPELLTALMRRAIDECERPELRLDAADPVDVAICRMLMLARRPFKPCPQDERVQRALWLALAIPQRSPGKKPARLRKLEAARALSTMAHHLAPRERQALYINCSGVADCAARMLAI
ncbi:MAG: hypothetical protein AAGU74_06675 [Bacillota bacterium]